MRLAAVTGLRRSEGSLPSVPPWPGALMGWPPQPVVWQILIEGVSKMYLFVVGLRLRTILYIGTEPYEKATVPRIILRV